MTVYTDMAEHVYHSRPELSSTGARHVLAAPARYRYWADNPQPGKRAFDIGTAAHTKILGVGAGTVVYPPEHLTPSGAVSTKAATVTWADKQRAAGFTPVSPGDQGRVDAMAEAVLAHGEARAVVESIVGREVSIIQTIDDVPVRARFDLYDGTRAGDLKTTRDASPGGFNKSVGQFGYHIQQAWYTGAHHAETGEPLTEFVFVVVESAPPHLVGVYTLDRLWVELGETRAAEARDTFRACTVSGRWPGFGRQELTPPTWAIFENEDEVEISF